MKKVFYVYGANDANDDYSQEDQSFDTVEAAERRIAELLESKENEGRYYYVQTYYIKR